MAPDDVPDPRLGTCSLIDYAAAMEQEIRRIGLKPIVVGHSMGGLLAQILGSRGLAKALVLLTPSSPAGIIALRFSVMKGFWSAQTKWSFWRSRCARQSTRRPTQCCTYVGKRPKGDLRQTRLRIRSGGIRDRILAL